MAEAWRSRRPVGARFWAKRLRYLPALFRQDRLVRRLRASGADVGERLALAPATLLGRFDRLSIGDGTAIDAATIIVRGSIEIGKCVAINAGVTILSGGHDPHSPTWEMEPQPIVIDDYAWIGTNAMVLGGVRIGKGAVVGAGTVVHRDVPDHGMVFGNPARNVGDRKAGSYDYTPSERWPMWRAWLGLTFSEEAGGVGTLD